MPTRLHVAVLDEELPFPPNSGKRIRTLRLLQRLAGRHDISYLCHRNADPDEARAAADALAGLGIAPMPVARPVPGKGGLMFPVRLAANLASPRPYSVDTHTSPELTVAAGRLAAGRPVDVWHCEWTPYFETADRIAAAPTVVVAHNVESVIWRRTEEATANPAKRWYVGRQRRKFERFERRAYSAADHTVAVSSADADLIRRQFGGRRVSVVDNGVDVAHFGEPPAGVARDPFRVLFLGSLDWRPNQDAVSLLLDEVFPPLKGAEPRATLAVVGRKPPRWLRDRVARVPGAELFADVPDVRPHLAAASALAVPLRVGGGSRLKILEALAAGVPVVSTAVGAEGLDLTAGGHLAVADAPTDLAAALLRLLRRPAEARRLADAGRRRVAAVYDWAGLADRLEAVWLDLADRSAFRRGARRPALTAA